MAARRDWRQVAFKVVVYLTTLVVACLLIWTMYDAYCSFGIVRRHWKLLLVAGTVYYGAAMLFVCLMKGFKRFVSHVALLQLLPLLAFLLVYCVVGGLGSIIVSGDGTKNEYERAFSDLQAAQRRAALKNGVEPFETRDDFENQCKKLQKEDKLVRISSNSGYVVQRLTHSVPYVVPKLENLLDDLADLFQKEMGAKVRFVVTSVLRTSEDIKKLQKVNVNASAKSCHCYATTVDISYSTFDCKGEEHKYEDLRRALAKSLRELQKDGRCYVKFEQKQKCYHITVR